MVFVYVCVQNVLHACEMLVHSFPFHDADVSFFIRVSFTVYIFNQPYRSSHM